MSEKKLKVAVIGCGQIAKMHIPAVLAKKECELYAVCDSADDNRMQLRMEEVGMPEFCKEHAYTDYMDLVNDPNVDIAIITTDDNSHKDITCAFLRAGKHATALFESWSDIDDRKYVDSRIDGTIGRNLFRY